MPNPSKPPAPERIVADGHRRSGATIPGGRSEREIRDEIRRAYAPLIRAKPLLVRLRLELAMWREIEERCRTHPPADALYLMAAGDTSTRIAIR